MNEFEFCQHKVTKRRADELRPTRDSTYKADGNRNLRLPVNVLSGGDSCAAIGDEPERHLTPHKTERGVIWYLSAIVRGGRIKSHLPRGN